MITYEINSESDKLRMAERIATARFVRPYVIKADFADKRSLDQNALMWSLLTDIARQVEWFGEKLSRDDWKTVFTAAVKQQRAIPGIDGGVVMLGQSTSRMSKTELSELVDFIQAFGVERNVKFREQA